MNQILILTVSVFWPEIQPKIVSQKFGASVCRHVATCKPGKPGLTSFSETRASTFLHSVSFISEDEGTRKDKTLPRAYQKKLAGYALEIVWCGSTSELDLEIVLRLKFNWTNLSFSTLFSANVTFPFLHFR